jgi:tRNA pseudouridine38-40 synthase
MLDAGQGKLDAQGFQRIVDARNRRNAGQSVPAAGLFLVDIGYDGFTY